MRFNLTLENLSHLLGGLVALILLLTLIIVILYHIIIVCCCCADSCDKNKEQLDNEALQNEEDQVYDKQNIKPNLTNLT